MADKHDQNDTEEIESPTERSAIASEIEDLRSTITRLANERERLPQPLFWSLFHTRLSKIRKTKELNRLLAHLFNEEGS